MIKSDEFVLFPMLRCLGNLIGKGKERIVLVSKIQDDYKIKANISINPINIVRYLSYCNLAEILVDYEKIIDLFLKNNLEAKNLTDTQIEYYKFYQDPFIKISLKFLKILSQKVIKPIMKKGNTTTSSDEYVKCLQKVLNEIETLKLSTLQDFTSNLIFLTYEKEQFIIKSKIIFHMLLDPSLFMLQKWESNYIQKMNQNGKDKFIIPSNRQAERYISSIKQLLDKNSNTRLIVIMSFCKLKNLNFNFNSFSKQLKILLKKHGRNLYNNSITRRQTNQQKVFLYFQQLDEKIEKQSGINRIDKIKDFLIDMEYLNKKDKLTIKNMQSILEKLRMDGYYIGTMKIGNKENYLKLFENQIMNINFMACQKIYLYQ